MGQTELKHTEYNVRHQPAVHFSSQTTLPDNASFDSLLEFDEAGPAPAIRQSTTSSAGGSPFPRTRKKSIDEEIRENVAKQFTGKIGLKNFRLVHYPGPQAAVDAEAAHGVYDTTEEDNGKYVYFNRYRQEVTKYDDVAVYLSPTNAEPRRMVVQATKQIYIDRRGSNDWIRTEVSGSVPAVLKMAEWALSPLSPSKPSKHRAWHRVDATLRSLLVALPMQVMLSIMLTIPILPSWEDGDVTDSYTEFHGYYWHWPKYAVNKLDMQPGDPASDKRSLLDVRNRRRPPRKLVIKQGDDWGVWDDWKVEPFTVEKDQRYVFISHVWTQFGQQDETDRLKRMSAKVAKQEKCRAYWLDKDTVEAQDGDDKNFDIYTICDAIRNSAKVAVLLSDNSRESKIAWGSRMWTLLEGMLAPGTEVLFCHEDATTQELITEPMHKIEMTNMIWREPGEQDEYKGGGMTRVLAEHFSGLLTLSRLELLPAAITALGRRKYSTTSKSDSGIPVSQLAYAVMGLLHYRIDRDDKLTLFQNLARLSLSNDNDQIIERMICLLPTFGNAAQQNPITVQDDNVPDKTTFDLLSQEDQFDTMVHDISPLGQVVGVAKEDETIIIDDCRAIHIRWKNFPQMVVQRHQGFKKAIAILTVNLSLWWITWGLQITINNIPMLHYLLNNRHSPETHGTILVYALMAGGFVIIWVIFGAFSPRAVRRLYGGKVMKSSSYLIGFEGTMPIKDLETLVFGNDNGRLHYAPSSTPFCRDIRNPLERRCDEPSWIKNPESIAHLEALAPAGHHIFTLVDTGELTVSIFSAERPPSVALLCGREGGMLRAVLCSWRFDNDCLYKETVVRMSSRVYDAAIPKGWLKLCLRTQNDARRRGFR